MITFTISHALMQKRKNCLCSGKVVSPKWKNFKGMKLTVKDKIRLNNAIWRTWHIQCMFVYWFASVVFG